MSSANSEQDTSVLRESVVPLPRRVPTAVAIEPTSEINIRGSTVNQTESVPPPTPVAPPRADHAFVGVLSALAAILAARLLLLLSVSFGFVLAIMAVRGDSYLGLAIVGTFAGLTVLPLVWLDVVTHRRGGS